MDKTRALESTELAVLVFVEVAIPVSTRIIGSREFGAGVGVGLGKGDGEVGCEVGCVGKECARVKIGSVTVVLRVSKFGRGEGCETKVSKD